MNHGVNMMRGHIEPSARIHYEWILDIAAGVARMTRTEHESFLITGVHPYTLVRPLQEAMQANLERVGAPQFSEADHEFARALQSFLDVETSGLRDKIDHLADAPLPAGGGSSDVAEVSYITSTVEFSVTTAAEHVPWHSWATSASHGTAGAIKGAQVATRALALMGAELMLDADLLARAKEAHARETGGVPYNSPIPEGQAVPLPQRGGS